ncbi:MAG TPA: 50S ribosomal protein L24 [Thermodesulfobacteriota bacterium]|mgnify:CR=1 FL=1|nr:50S ribosomal protein L24 [Thermodesulfobacteriota bacterium]
MALTEKKISVHKKKFNIKAGDTVYVTAGKEKGKTGKVIKVLKKKDGALVEKLNIVKRHEKQSQKNPTGGIVEKEAPIHVSNLMLLDSVDRKPVRIGRKVLSSGEKVRYSKKSGEEIRK